MTPQQFYAETVGKQIDYDGAYSYQCVDAFRYWGHLNSVPIPPTPNNFADGYWYSRDQLGFSVYFDYIQTPNFRTGDWVFWARGSKSHSSSHVAMYLVFDGVAYEYSENQGGNGGFCLKTTDFSDALGALRWKGYKDMEIEKGYHHLSWNGINIDIIRATYASGYRLHLLSAGDAFALKDIMEYNSDKLGIVGCVNSNYFDMASGLHLGVEGDGYVNGYFQAPKAAGVLAYYINDQGVVGAHDQSDFWLGQDQIQVACAPYAVLIHQGQTVDMHSTSFGSKDLVRNTQTAVMRLGDDWTLAIFSECYPSDVLKFALEAGANELALMDSGGSCQMFECATTGTRRQIRHTSRKLPNVLVLAKEIDGAPATTEPPEEQTDVPEPDPPTEEEPSEEKPEPTGIFDMSSKTYDILKYIAQIVLPALATLIVTVGQIVGLKNAEQIAGVIIAVDAFLGALLQISSNTYYARKEADTHGR